MKLVWCPDKASEAFIDAVNILKPLKTNNELAEMVAAMAGGWNAQCIVEILMPSSKNSKSTSLALSAASRRTGGRHVVAANEFDEIEGMEFAVVDFERRDAEKVLRAVRVGPRGAVLVFKNGGGRQKWKDALMEGSRIVRSAYLPIGSGGLEIVHIGVGEGWSLSDHLDNKTLITHQYMK